MTNKGDSESEASEHSDTEVSETLIEGLLDSDESNP